MSLHPFPLDPGPGFCVSVCIRKVSDIFLFGNSKNFFGRIFREKFCGNGELCVTLQRLRRGAPRLGTTIVLWCNGSTTVFGSVCLGSNPGKTTIKREGNHGRMANGFLLLFLTLAVFSRPASATFKHLYTSTFSPAHKSTFNLYMRLDFFRRAALIA